MYNIFDKLDVVIVKKQIYLCFELNQIKLFPTKKKVKH